MELIATWWAAALAALICAVPAALLLVVYLFADLELPAEGSALFEYFGKFAVPIAAPLTAALLVGPSGDLWTVALVAAGVTAGLFTFFGVWEPFLHRAGGHRSLLRATVATVAALAVGVAVTVLLVSVLTAWLAVPVVLLVAVRMLPASMSADRYWFRSLQVDGDEVDCRQVELAMSQEGSWQLAWIGPAREPVAGQVTFRAEWGDRVITGGGALTPLEAEDVPDRWAVDRQPQGTGWKLVGRVRDLRCDGRRVRVTHSRSPW